MKPAWRRFWRAVAGFALNRASDRVNGPAWRVARYSTEAEYDAAYAKWEAEVLSDQPTVVFDAVESKVYEQPRTSSTMPGRVTWRWS